MAFTPCTTAGLTANIATPCTEPRIKGYEQIGLIILKSDIDLAVSTVDTTNPRIIDAFALKAGKKVAVIYNSRKTPLPFNGTQATYNRAENQYDKVVQFYYEGVGGANSLGVVEPLKDGDYIVILERKQKYGAGSFQVIGWQNGLSAGNEGGAQVQDEETGYWLITMATQEPFAEMELDAGGYALTKAEFDILVADAK